MVKMRAFKPPSLVAAGLSLTATAALNQVMRTVKCILLSCLGVVAAQAADLPELVLPQGVGVNIHFTRGHERDLDLIAAAGFKFIRMDFGWGGIERKKGEFIWSAYDELTANLHKRGLRAIYILDYSNPLYEETVVSKNPITAKEHNDLASPQHPESVAAFARWAGAAAKHFKGHRVIWEIWNEPNISFWKPKPDVTQYAALALATAKALREADPNATILNFKSASSISGDGKTSDATLTQDSLSLTLLALPQYVTLKK